MLSFIERILEDLTKPKFVENEYTTIKKIGKYWHSVYIDFNKKREVLAREREKSEKEKLKNDFLSLDYNKTIFLSSKWISNTSTHHHSEYTLVWVTWPEDLLKRLQSMKSSDVWLKIPISLF